MLFITVIFHIRCYCCTGTSVACCWHHSADDGNTFGLTNQWQKLVIDLFDGKDLWTHKMFTREFFSNQTSTIYQFPKVLLCVCFICICMFAVFSVYISVVHQHQLMETNDITFQFAICCPSTLYCKFSSFSRFHCDNDNIGKRCVGVICLYVLFSIFKENRILSPFARCQAILTNNSSNSQRVQEWVRMRENSVVPWKRFFPYRLTLTHQLIKYITCLHLAL